ncbi:Protein lunapark-1 [Toxocara canis]|uniref:Endoplasmic reticulum junction formation protein lunapark n=1 Tax=Toxocara canis TaxID=6265 RepID=A0A0B2URI8_TOXCA|nr:Protein lunapark-1 [Toxocara canis]
MGNILFRHKKVVTEELEEIQQRSKSLEQEISRAVQNKHSMQWLCSLTLFALTGLSVATVLFYEPDKKRRTAYSVLSACGGLLLMYVTSVFTNGYYEWLIGKKRRTYDEITKRKIALLEQIKETETFKVAKEILDKYGDPSTRSSEPVPGSREEARAAVTKTPLPSNSPAGSEASAQKSEERHGLDAESLPTLHFDQPVRSQLVRRPPRPFVKQERSMAEKFVDFLLGDGPNYRYALVCANCYAHNGMAHEQEFDYFSYHCWVCGAFNPARKQRIINRTSPHVLHPQSLVRARSESAGLNKAALGGTEATKRTRLRSESLQRPVNTDNKVVTKEQSDFREGDPDDFAVKEIEARRCNNLELSLKKIEGNDFFVLLYK